ncbi:hypothetical protein J2Y40_004176 [Chryseobacterium sp. 2987]|nr:hypothetical protein [Chryseobacterium sp. 2987]
MRGELDFLDEKMGSVKIIGCPDQNGLIFSGKKYTFM